MENVIEDGIVNITLYSEETLKNLAYQQIWKGNGTKTDPFIIKNSNILGQEIIIKNSSLFLSFFNCNFDHVIFERSSNISLKHCTFNKLEVIKCSQFEITSSYISDLSMSKITDFQFKKSSIIEVSTRSKILEIIFEDCDINDNFLDSIRKQKFSNYYSQFKEVFPSYILIFSSFIVYRLFYTLFVLKSSDLVNVLFISFLIITIIGFLFSILIERISKRKPVKVQVLNTWEHLS